MFRIVKVFLKYAVLYIQIPYSHKCGVVCFFSLDIVVSFNGFSSSAVQLISQSSVCSHKVRFVYATYDDRDEFVSREVFVCALSLSLS